MGSLGAEKGYALVSPTVSDTLIGLAMRDDSIAAPWAAPVPGQLVR
jgi:hypothetical protein